MTIYNLVSDIGGAITAFVIGWLLTLSGYVPDIEQSDFTIGAIIACSSIIPFVGVAIGLRILKSYDLYEREDVSDGARLVDDPIPPQARGRSNQCRAERSLLPDIPVPASRLTARLPASHRWRHVDRHRTAR